MGYTCFISEQTIILALNLNDNKFDINSTSQLPNMFPIHICISLDYVGNDTDIQLYVPLIFVMYNVSCQVMRLLK